MKTGGVKFLIEDVLSAMPQPYSVHVIDEVFALVERTPKWFREYESLCETLGKDLTNNSVGYWVAVALGKVGKRQVPGTRSTLNGSYSILDTDARTFSRKPNEQEALTLMADYYKRHKSSLSQEVRKHREQIVELIMAGTSPEDAFTMVLASAA